MKHCLFLSVFLLSFNGYGQLKVKTADAHFRKMEYARCVEMYNELSYKAIKKSDPNRNDYIRKAAICNFKLFNMSEAEAFFNMLKNANQLTEKDRELYLQTLRYLGKYSESYSLALESSNLFGSNSYFQAIVKDNDASIRLFEDSSLYKIYELIELNSGFGDFSPAISNGELYYTTKSSNTRALNPTYGWDDSYYLNVKRSVITSDSTCSSGMLLKGSFITKAHDGPVSFNSKGDQVVITRNAVERSKGKEVIRLSLYFSKLENGVWTSPVPFPHNDPNFNTGHAVFAENDKAIYFTCDKHGGHGGTDLYVSRLDVNNNWSSPENLGSTVNTSMNEMFPFVVGQKLFFASNGHFGLGGLDIFEFDIASGSKVKNLGYPLNTSFDDFGLITDLSGEKGYYSSNRSDNIDRIYAFKKMPINIFLQGIVYATYSEREAMPSQPVVLTRISDGYADTIITNEFGQFQYKLEPNETYKLFTSKEEFTLIREGAVQTNGIKRDSVLFCDLPLRPNTLQVRLRVVEMGSGKPIAYSKATVTDYTLNKESILYTNEDGIVSLKVDRDKTYWAHASKKGFVDGNIAFNSANENDRIIDLELKLPPIVKGDIFKLENIFYDLNKSSLRPESMLALDKLAEFIIKNEVRIELSSHTDARGSDAYNLKLSQARAQSCVDYLISKGVKKSQIIAKGYGETKLINRCKNGVDCPEDLHQENRRTEVKIL
jgi:outer membrane protein OmpA-like peptidoglycan-associated protein